MKKTSLLFLLTFICFNITAQNSAENKLGAWYMYNGSHKLSDKIALKTMAHFRYYEIANEFQQEIYRLGFNYKINAKTNFTLGYSFVNTDATYNVVDSNIDEHRIYEDLHISHKVNTFKLRHRFRIEHRFFDDNTSNWLRYDLNATYPISEKWSVYAFNEIFLHLDKGKRFAQNWTGTGFLHQLNNNMKIKLGYFQIKTPDNTFKRMQLGIIINTDHTKKKS